MVCTQSFSFASKYAFDAAELDFIFLATVLPTVAKIEKYYFQNDVSFPWQSDVWGW